MNANCLGCILSHSKAGIAQLVERNLAKVEVAGSNPVFRSNRCANRSFFFDSTFLGDPGSGGGIGRHVGLKIQWPLGCTGSSPVPSTN